MNDQEPRMTDVEADWATIGTMRANMGAFAALFSEYGPSIFALDVSQDDTKKESKMIEGAENGEV